jgi:proton-dependent oligopeptide transporter, POT family
MSSDALLNSNGSPGEKTFFGHPRGLAVLFFTEMWERFSYYGMRGILTLFLAKHFLFGDEKSFLIYGTYTSLVYATPIFGGMIADKLLGFSRSVLVGGILMGLGQFALAASSLTTDPVLLNIGLGLMIVGNGFFKPNISTIVGKLYKDDDPKKDSGFTIFYMGINLGAFLAPLIAGVAGEVYGWHYGFGAAGIGMFIGLISFWLNQDKLMGKGLPPNPEKLKQKFLKVINIEHAVWLIAILMVPVVAVLISFNDWQPLGVFEDSMPAIGGMSIMSWILAVIGLIVIGIVVSTSLNSTREEWQRLLVAMVLTFFSIVFWAFFEQAGSSMTLFTDRNVDREVFGFLIPTSTFQAVNAFFIIALGIPFSMLWIWLNKKHREPSTPLKFSIGLIQVGLGFGIMVVGARMFASSEGLVPIMFLILAYFLHTTGELCLSPVGLSMITKLSPAKIVGFMMGVWFLSPSIAQYIGGIIAAFTSIPEGGSGEGDSLSSLLVYGDVFSIIMWFAVGSGVFLLILTPILRKMMHGIH